jgi:hypothetical protein
MKTKIKITHRYDVREKGAQGRFYQHIPLRESCPGRPDIIMSHRTDGAAREEPSE